MTRIASYLSLVVFPHTLFALPFALLSMVLAADGFVPLPTLGWILAAMVGARSAAMSFNRIVDRGIDAKNPRTAAREIPAGVVTVAQASLFCLASIALFVVAAARLNRLCLLLSPVALAIVLGYSYMKRFTAGAHLVLGLSLAIAPAGAWIAVRGTLDAVPVLLGLGVVAWVAGFDVLYSLQDEEFDRRQGLRSVPVLLGERRAMLVAALLHAVALGFFFATYVAAAGGILFGAGVVLAGAFLVRQHTLVRPGDLSRINAAFFTANGWLSMAFFVFGAADVLLRGRLPL